MVEIDRNQFELAILHGWEQCVPEYHLNFDRAWERLSSGACNRSKNYDPDGDYLDACRCWTPEEVKEWERQESAYVERIERDLPDG